MAHSWDVTEECLMKVLFINMWQFKTQLRDSKVTPRFSKSCRSPPRAERARGGNTVTLRTLGERNELRPVEAKIKHGQFRESQQGGGQGDK